MRVLAPASGDEAAAMLGNASRAGERVGIRGGGTKLDWVRARQPDVMLSTERLNTVVAHRHGDLTATVEAGATLAEVNRALGAHGQWIPLDPLWPARATIGGIVATNDAGPRRHRYGAPRDLIIGVDIARADGVRAKAGGIVVKNVAGYDLARLVTGSFGCLGLILTATFKLYPVTPASRTVVADMPNHAAAGALVSAMLASQLTPTAIELQAPPVRLLIRFESIAASVDEQSRRVVSLAESHGASAHVVAGDDEAREWNAHADRVWSSSGTILKLTLLPTDLSAVLDAIAAAAAGLEVAITGRAGLGVLFVRLAGDHALQQRAIDTLRSRIVAGRGGLVVVRAAEEIAASVDKWGPLGDAFPLMQAVMRSFDPQGILNPGSGPGGI